MIDTIKHCMDGSDESPAYCNVRVCPENYIQCNNRRCVPANQTCMDDSECSDDHFRCATGQCIELKHRCDRGNKIWSLILKIKISSHKCAQIPIVQTLQMRLIVPEWKMFATMQMES